MVKVIVAGSRSIQDFETVQQAIVRSPWWPLEVSNFVHGGAKGVDSLADDFARDHGYSPDVFDPLNPDETLTNHSYHEEGKVAFLERNTEMAKYADALVAVRENKSSGTTDMIKKALKENLNVYIKNID